MMADGQWVVTADEVDRKKGKALLELQRAKERVAALYDDAGEAARKFLKVGKLLGSLESQRGSFQGPATELLQLPVMDFDPIVNLAAMKALTNAILTAERELQEASRKAQSLGLPADPEIRR